MTILPQIWYNFINRYWYSICMESKSTIEHDIAELEKQLEAKKASLEHDKTETITEGGPSEKEMLHEVVGQKIKEHIPSYSPTTKVSVSTTPEPPSYLSQELKDKVREIINLVFAKNLEEGIAEAGKSGNPALIDAFHDMLVDELYDQLVEKRKLAKVE